MYAPYVLVYLCGERNGHLYKIFLADCHVLRSLQFWFKKSDYHLGRPEAAAGARHNGVHAVRLLLWHGGSGGSTPSLFSGGLYGSICCFQLLVIGVSRHNSYSRHK
jgi:hypothetical protein